MNIVGLVAVNIASVTGIFFGLYLFGRVFIPELAENDVFFSSPKLGRIKARRRSGRIINFIDNLIRKGKHVNMETGRIEDGEIPQNGFWWNLFGVHFIGLDEIYKYRIAIEATVGEDGQLKYVEKDASSIYLEGSYPLTAILVTKDGVRLRVKLQLKTTTIDAARALSLPVSWTIPVFTAVLGACRDFFGARNVETLISAQNERGVVTIGTEKIENSGFIDLILSLNTPRVGNISLEEICGQYINAVNLVDMDFIDPEMKKAFSAPFIAGQEAQREVRNAEAYAVAVQIKSEADRRAADNQAKAIALKGNAEADVYGKKHGVLGGDSKATAQVITAERQSTMTNLTTLVNGSGSVISVPTDKKPEAK